MSKHLAILARTVLQLQSMSKSGSAGVKSGVLKLIGISVCDSASSSGSSSNLLSSGNHSSGSETTESDKIKNNYEINDHLRCLNTTVRFILSLKGIVGSRDNFDSK